jgi:hypothetical protein
VWLIFSLTHWAEAEGGHASTEPSIEATLSVGAEPCGPDRAHWSWAVKQWRAARSDRIDPRRHRFSCMVAAASPLGQRFRLRRGIDTRNRRSTRPHEASNMGRIRRSRSCWSHCDRRCPENSRPKGGSVKIHDHSFEPSVIHGRCATRSEGHLTAEWLQAAAVAREVVCGVGNPDCNLLQRCPLLNAARR